MGGGGGGFVRNIKGLHPGHGPIHSLGARLNKRADSGAPTLNNIVIIPVGRETVGTTTLVTRSRSEGGELPQQKVLHERARTGAGSMSGVGLPAALYKDRLAHSKSGNNEFPARAGSRSRRGAADLTGFIKDRLNQTRQQRSQGEQRNR